MKRNMNSLKIKSTTPSLLILEILKFVLNRQLMKLKPKRDPGLTRLQVLQLEDKEILQL